MSNIVIEMIPKPDDSEVLTGFAESFRTIRLKSLKTDPEAFLAKYEDEAQQDLEFWVERLKTEHVHHFAAIQSEDPEIRSDEIEFKGIIVVVVESERHKPITAAAQIEIREEKKQPPVYSLQAFWVDPTVRGQGIGSELVRRSIDWIEEQAIQKGYPSVRCVVTVASSNATAMALYMKHGFGIDHTGTILEGYSSKMHTIMSKVVDCQDKT